MEISLSCGVKLSGQGTLSVCLSCGGVTQAAVEGWMGVPRALWLWKGACPCSLVGTL